MSNEPIFFSQNKIHRQDPFPQTTNVNPKKTPKSFSISTLVVVAIVSTLVASSTTYLITKNVNQEKETIFSDEEEPELSDVNVKTVTQTDGSESTEDVIKQLDEKINSSGSDSEESFNTTMTKIAFLFDYEQYDEAKNTLDSIPQDNLTNYELFQIYNNYKRYYEQIGDTANASLYEEKATDAEAKYILE